VAYGHKNITGTHKSTFEITREDELTPAGSCIIAIGAEKGAADLSDTFRKILQKPGAVLETRLTCEDFSVIILSEGSPDLALSHKTDMVWRRASFTCDRTIGIHSDHTARNIPREMIKVLKSGSILHIHLIVSSRD